MTSRLIVLRGNSGSGKSSVVEAIRERYGHGIAYIEQDYVRRTVFQELAEPDGANIELIGQMASYALARGFHAVVEGILPTVRYGGMLARLHRDHGGHFYYLDIPFEETVRRHATRDKASAFAADDMADWYRPKDLLDEPRETVIDETSSLDATVQQILNETGLCGPAAQLQVGDDDGLTGRE
ncbi:adenylylsulfate kinase-like enzyme [Kribbella aluminosa]|uniref:Adenylylsulfate kinase-like enzyme n=1 Tax=Kribbella aluminosa TaxID=416017 RepID=A0ABS4UC37_9ACTN|nr:kinase [Kribbella aluminosa]MBP2349202.1 adenylylsulfate kinase-like enzyme [Kribbella aluminosa]